MADDIDNFGHLNFGDASPSDIREMVTRSQRMNSSGWAPTATEMACRLRARHRAELFEELECAQLASKLYDCKESNPKAPRKLGRTKGSGSYARSDAPLLDEMQKLIDKGEAQSAHAASRIVADRAIGGGTSESKASRLAKAFRTKSEVGD